MLSPQNLVKWFFFLRNLVMNIDALTQDITDLHHKTIPIWTESGVCCDYESILKPIAENHGFNFQLWLAEDRARREDMGHHFVYQAKREIDQHNQQRNNRMEAIDEWLEQHITLATPEHCPIHSETPGMMIDRLSILSLKLYHMGLQTVRNTADDDHRQLCTQKLRVLEAQHTQLTQCLQQLLHDLVSQTRTFRRYHQFKMYNDPNLNPELHD